MKFEPPKSLLSAILMIAVLFFVSCGDDDKIDCNKAIDTIEEAFDDYEDAYDDGNCEDLDDLFDDAVKALRKGKNCSNVKDELDDAGYDNVEDFIDDFEDEHEENKDDCNEPA